MKTNYLLIKPNDTLFFRNGMPFGKGEETVAETILIPYPSTVWGAMFSTLLIQKKIQGTNIADQKKLKLKNIYLYDIKYKNILVPAPLDIFNDTLGKAYAQKFIESTVYSNNTNSTYSHLIMPSTSENVESANGFYLQITDLVRHYPFENHYSYITLYDASSFLGVYSKIGIARSNETFTAEEGSLYNVQMLEYKDNWGFIVEFECEIDFPNSGILKLGGEGKTAAYELIEKPYDLHSFEKEQENCVTDLCKIYFQTPTFIPPDFLNKVNAEAAFIGKSLSIGGFDVKKGQPKVMLKAVPPGSFFVLSSDNPISIENWRESVETVLRPSNDKGFGAFQIIPVHEIN